MLAGMQNMTPPAVRQALEKALFGILQPLVMAHGADAVREGLWQMGAFAHVLERRAEERTERARRRGGRPGPTATPWAAPAAELVTDADIEAVRRRHREAEYTPAEEVTAFAHDDRGLLLEQVDRLRAELTAATAHEEPMTPPPATCAACLGEILPDEDVHTTAAASRVPDEDDELGRIVEVCAACARRERPARAPTAASEPRPRLASGTRVLPAALRKAG